MAGLKIFLFIPLFFLMAGCVQENKTENKSNIKPDDVDFSMFIGKWYSGESSNSYDDTIKKGGYVLEIIEINQNYIKGYTASISSSPSYRMAGFDFEGKLTENKLVVDFIDGFDNKGNATIRVIKDIIEIKVVDFELSDNNSSGWGYNGDVIFEIGKEK